jgi:hypothetical protein
MPVDPGSIGISTPSPGAHVLVGQVHVAGGTTAGRFDKLNGTSAADLPPSSVEVRLDGRPPQVATQRGPDWNQWDVLLEMTTPGPHTIVARARLSTVWEAGATVNVSAFASRMLVDGVEHTQSIQFFDYNFRGSAAGSDNSVPLVAQKATVLRTYVPYRTKPPNSVFASGELSIGPDRFPPINGPVRLRAKDDIDRGIANHTLNFLLPPTACVGTLDCTIRVFDPNFPDGPPFEGESTFTLTFLPTPRLRIHGLLIHYVRAVDIPAPTSTAFTVTLDTTARAGPIHQNNYTGFTVMAFDGDLTAPATLRSSCGPGWDALLATLRQMRTASGATDLYVALLPTGVPLAPVAATGCGSAGVAAGSDGQGFDLMHEVGHALARLHAPCPANVMNPDPAYPTFTNPNTNRPPYPAGTIGEYGFNLATRAVLAPQDTFDVMTGGCQSTWISPYTYRGMLDRIVNTQPFSPPFTGGGGRDAERFSAVSPAGIDDERLEYLHLIVRLHEDGNVELVSAFHVLGPRPVREPGPVSSVTCELLTEDGEVLESARLYEELLQRRGGPYTQYFGSLPLDASVAAIVLTRDGETLYTRRLPDTAPPVRLGSPERRDDVGRRVRFSWVADVPDATPVTYIPRYSHDDGETWRAVGPGQREASCELDLDTLPGGERCCFQVLAFSDVRTSIATSDRFAVQMKPTVAQILAPADDAEVEHGEPVSLYARAFSPDFGTTPLEEMLWFSNRDGLVGVGYETVATQLSPGRHELTLRVPDGLGGESEPVVAINVITRVQAT